MIFGLNQPKQGLHFEWNRFFRKKIFSCFSYLMVPTKMVQISFCAFLTNWLEIFLLVLEQSLRIPYVYTVYLVDLLACLTKYQQSSTEICAKVTPTRYNFKAWIPEETQSCLFDETIFFPLVFNYTSQKGLIYLLLNISQANSMEPQISNKPDPGELPTSLTHENDPRVWPTRMTHENDPRVWPTRITHEFDPRDPRDLAHSVFHAIKKLLYFLIIEEKMKIYIWMQSFL